MKDEDETDFALQDDDDEIEIEVVDDKPPEDRGKPGKPTDPDDDTLDEEIADYGERAQKRIKRLTYERHEERRAREQHERMAQEAVRYAEAMKAENERLSRLVDDSEEVMVGQAKSRLEAQLEKAKQEYKQAYEEGDADKVAEASATIAKLSAESDRVGTYKPKPRRQQEQPRQHQPQPQPQPQQPTLSPRAQDWVKENEWVTKDPAMRGAVLALHQDLAEKYQAAVQNGRGHEAIAIDSDEYYDAINKGIREAFPHKFGGNEDKRNRQAGNVVAPAKRSAKGPRTVRLTQTQRDLANRMGVPLKKYAEQLLKMQEQEGQ